VRTEAVGVNFGDTRIRSGAVPARRPLPLILGGEAVGVVSGTGEGVDPGLAGAMVAIMTPGGAYAEYVVAPADEIVNVPDGVPPCDAVAVCA
jgi:NADPH:quinone reductase